MATRPIRTLERTQLGGSEERHGVGWGGWKNEIRWHEAGKIQGCMGRDVRDTEDSTEGQQRQTAVIALDP